MYYFGKHEKSGSYGFFHLSVGGIPAGAVPVTPKDHALLMTAQANGKQIVPDLKGRPTVIDPPPPPVPVQRETLRALCRHAISESQPLVDHYRDALELQTVLPISPARYKTIMQWRQALRALPDVTADDVLLTIKIPVMP